MAAENDATKTPRRRGRPRGATSTTDPRKGVHFSLPRSYVPILDARAAARAGDRSLYLRRLVQADLIRPDSRRSSVSEMNIIDQAHGLWSCSDGQAEFDVYAIRPEDIVGFDLDDLTLISYTNGQAALCGPEQAQYMLGNERMRPGTSPDFQALGLEAVRRIVAGERIVSDWNDLEDDQ